MPTPTEPTETEQALYRASWKIKELELEVHRLSDLHRLVAANFGRGLLPAKCNEPPTLIGKVVALMEYANEAMRNSEAAKDQPHDPRD